MRVLGQSSQAEMVAEFLRAEYESTILDHVRQLVTMDYCPERFITHPDTSNPRQNTVRESALMAYRGNFFRGFPAAQVRWFRAAIGSADLERVRYVTHDTWVQLSGATHRMRDAVERIRTVQTIYPPGSDLAKTVTIITEIAATIRNGRTPGEFPKAILVGQAVDEPLVIVEGYKRLTGFLLARDHLPHAFEVLVGLSARISEWPWFPPMSSRRA